MLPLLATMLLFLLGVAHSSSPTPNSGRPFRSDPYAILRLDPGCTQQEIQRSYRALCLRHHPDKAPGGGDFAFKEVQHAYSLIGTAEDRRDYERRRTDHLQFPSHGSDHPAFPGRSAGHWPNNNRFGERAGSFDPSTIYFRFGGQEMSFRFANGRIHHAFPRRGHASARDSFEEEGARKKTQIFRGIRPHYIQKISIPLAVLYSGAENVELELNTSLFGRYRAAYNGGALKPAVVSGAMAVLSVWLRTQKVNWWLSLFLFAIFVHAGLPPPPEKVKYRANLRRGWKGGTKIKYSSAAADVTFVLQEDEHETFARVGNDLHARVQVSAQQLRNGCTLTIDPLGAAEEPIEIKLKRRSKNGQIVTVKSRGWPRGIKEKDCGDLRVEICCDAS